MVVQAGLRVKFPCILEADERSNVVSLSATNSCLTITIDSPIDIRSPDNWSHDSRLIRVVAKKNDLSFAVVRHMFIHCCTTCVLT
jgi:hypothetical protein